VVPDAPPDAGRGFGFEQPASGPSTAAVPRAAAADPLRRRN